MKQSTLDDFTEVPWEDRECLDEGRCRCTECIALRAIFEGESD